MSRRPVETSRLVPHDFREWAHFSVRFADGSYASTRFLDGKRTRHVHLAYVWKANVRRCKPLDVLEAWCFADRRRAPFTLVKVEG